MVASRQAEQLERIARTHECGTCGPRSCLTVRWWQGAYQCWCPVCRATAGFKRRKSLTQQWRENPESVDIATANRLSDKYADDIEEVARGLPEDLGDMVRRRYLGEPIPKEE